MHRSARTRAAPHPGHATFFSRGRVEPFRDKGRLIAKRAERPEITAPDRRSSPDPLRRSMRPARIPLRAGQFSADRIGPRPRNSAGESDSPDRRLGSIVRVQMIFCRRRHQPRRPPLAKRLLLAQYSFNSLHDWHSEILLIVAIISQLIHIILEALCLNNRVIAFGMIVTA